MLNPPAKRPMRPVPQENYYGAESIEEGYGTTIIRDANPLGRAHREINQFFFDESLATREFDGLKDKLFLTVEKKSISIRLG